MENILLNDIFIVEEDDYRAFRRRLIPEKTYKKDKCNDRILQVEFYSAITDELLCAYVREADEDRYYIVNLPKNGELKPEKPIIKVVIEDPNLAKEVLECIFGKKEEEDA